MDAFQGMIQQVPSIVDALSSARYPPGYETNYHDVDHMPAQDNRVAMPGVVLAHACCEGVL